MKKLLVMISIISCSLAHAVPVNDENGFLPVHGVSRSAQVQIPADAPKNASGYGHLPPPETTILSPRTAPVTPVGQVQIPVEKPTSVANYLAALITFLSN